MDLIERQKAIDALADMHCKSDEDGYVWIIRSDARAMIDALPSAQPEQRWIPCSERLPEMGSTVLMQNTGGWMFVATYAVTPKRKYWAVLEHDYALDEAIAWMPLPEPFILRRKMKKKEGE